MLLTCVRSNVTLIWGRNGGSGEKMLSGYWGNWRLIGDWGQRKTGRNLKQKLKNSAAVNSCWVFYMGKCKDLGSSRPRSFVSYGRVWEGQHGTGKIEECRLWCWWELSSSVWCHCGRSFKALNPLNMKCSRVYSQVSNAYLRSLLGELKSLLPQWLAHNHTQ